MKTWQRITAILLAVATGLALFRWGKMQITSVSTAASTEQPVRMVVLMCHAINSNPKKSGDYVITAKALEKDLQYIKEQGYQTVVMSDIIAYVRDGTPLPQKPIMITFDDGYYNNYLNAFPLLQKYEMKAVVSIIVGETDKYSNLNENKENYSHLTWEMINEMMESGWVEFQNHSYNMHKLSGPRRGVCRKSGESTEEYLRAVGEDLQKGQDRIEEMTGWRPNTFTYPFGSYSKESEPLLAELGFEASLGVEGKLFCLTRSEDCLIRIPRYNRSCKTSAEAILTKAFPCEGGG